MTLDRKPLPTIWVTSDGALQEQELPDAARLDRDEWCLITDPQVRLHPGLEGIIDARCAERPEIGIFYGDEVVAQSGSAASWLHLCKPSFDHTQIIAQDYIGWPIAIRGWALARLGGLDRRAGSALTYDLLLRAISEGIGIERITEVLAVHSKPPPRSNVADRAAALERWRDRSAPGCEIRPGMAAGTFRVHRIFGTPPEVTIVVPTCQGRRGTPDGVDERKPMVVDFLESLCATEWPMERITVLIGDDVDDGSIYEARQWPFCLERVVTRRWPGQPFNYAAKMNRLWRRAPGEYLILMNDDLVVRRADWLQALMTFAVSKDVGGVGARLLYPDDRIQHAGMPAGMLGMCAHAFIGRPASAGSYQNWAEVHREWSIVTGAVFATRKSVLSQVNGFDEKFALDYNDVDLCLRLRLLGYRIVYTPYAELTHYESASRGAGATPGDELALVMERWHGFMDDDPAYHPLLTRATPDVAPVAQGDAWWGTPAWRRGVSAEH